MFEQNHPSRDYASAFPSSTEEGSLKFLASAAFAFEFAHEFDEDVDALFRKCVIDRRAHSPDIPVSFESVEACRGGLLDEQLLQFFGGEPECHIHERPAAL